MRMFYIMIEFIYLKNINVFEKIHSIIIKKMLHNEIHWVIIGI